jgi:adenosylcobinamide-phosphate synthase
LAIDFLIPLVAVSVIILAAMIDLLLGEPAPWNPWKRIYNLHPTVLMGNFTKALEPYFKNPNPKIEKLNGVFLALIVIAVFTVPTYLGLKLVFDFLGIVVFAVIAAFLLKLTICLKLETDGAKGVVKALEAGDLTEAKKFAHFSRRDPRNLTGSQIGSAVIESMAENLIDFKLSPILFYAFFGVTGAVAFRAVNTLDGTVGFKDPEHIHIGWFSANLDSIINYIPARLTTILIVLASAILGKDYKNAWAIARRDHAKTPSRNHGWPMAAMAGALRIQLEKPGQYVLGEQTEELSPTKIIGALRIRNVAIILWILIMLPILVLTSLYLFPL